MPKGKLAGCSGLFRFAEKSKSLDDVFSLAGEEKTGDQDQNVTWNTGPSSFEQKASWLSLFFPVFYA
jgi:hypothetical protein